MRYLKSDNGIGLSGSELVGKHVLFVEKFHRENFWNLLIFDFWTLITRKLWELDQNWFDFHLRILQDLSIALYTFAPGVTQTCFFIYVFFLTRYNFVNNDNFQTLTRSSCPYDSIVYVYIEQFWFFSKLDFIRIFYL